METWLLHIIDTYGYMGIFLLIALENIFPPIPSEIILTFGGFMTTTSQLTLFGVITSSTAGSVMGAIVLFLLGKAFSFDKWREIIRRWGYLLRLKEKDIYIAKAWFQKFGNWTVFFCRFIPLIRSLISIPAGMAEMNFLIFIVYTFCGTILWNIVLVNLGAAVGHSWEDIVVKMDMYSNFVYILLMTVICGFLLYLWSKRKK